MAAPTVPAMKIAVLHYQPAGEPVDKVVTDVSAALSELGHTPVLVGVHDRVFDLLKALEKAKPDLVFNVCETFADDYRLEVNVAAVMEMAGMKFTGSGTAGLLLAQNKILTKQLLEYHEVPTPRFLTFDGDAFEAFGRMSFPLIVKPARTDASLGISRHSVVNDWEDMTRRVREIRKTFNDEALAEEFIDGREMYVGVLGNGTRPEILPILELNWGKWDPSVPKVSDRAVKFADLGEDGPFLMVAKDVTAELKARIERSALLAFRALKLYDYARVDFRISAKGEPFVLEVNPNPYLEKESELGMAAEERGLSYPQLIGRIIESAAIRYGMRVKPEKTITGETPAAEQPRT
jgi:D-alanine-D-alanine ligase